MHLSRFSMLLAALLLISCGKTSGPKIKKEALLARLRTCRKQLETYHVASVRKRITALVKKKGGVPVFQNTNLTTLAQNRYRQLLDSFFPLQGDAFASALRGRHAPMTRCMEISKCDTFAPCVMDYFQVIIPSEETVEQTTYRVKHPLRKNPVKSLTPPKPAKHWCSGKYDLAKHFKELEVAPAKSRFPSLLSLGINSRVAIHAFRGKKLVERYGKDLPKLEGSVSGVLFGPRGQLMMYTEKELLLFEKGLTAHIAWRPGEGKRIAAMARHGEQLLVATEGSLVVLGSDLKEMGRVHLGLENPKKEAHHIITHENTAYLLDNRYTPMLVFSVDIANPRSPKILQRINVGGVNSHLVHQWYDSTVRRWGVISTSYNRAGGFHSVLLIDPSRPNPKAKPDPRGFMGILKLPPPVLKEHNIWASRNRFPKRQKGEKASMAQWLVGSTEPPYLNLMREGPKFFLKRITLTGDTVSLEGDTLVGELAPCPMEEESLDDFFNGVPRNKRKKRKINRPEDYCYRYKRFENVEMDATGDWVVTHVLGNTALWKRKETLLRKVTSASAKPTLLLMLFLAR
ncbi:hypothetical protein KKF84_19490 [Myxococcota bacterium]|nr:hypothetical protein [Myxococcota bacterium]MBU1537507.1 hypothetical protein [Myxococcota bacterium]